MSRSEVLARNGVVSIFDNIEKDCRIYEDRPISCKKLECWNPNELLEMVERDTLSRLDILDEDDPLRKIVEDHERRFPCPDLEKLVDAMVAGTFDGKNAVDQLVNDELLFRTQMVNEHKLQLHRELFYFGRPLFQILQPLGIGISETGGWNSFAMANSTLNENPGVQCAKHTPGYEELITNEFFPIPLLEWRWLSALLVQFFRLVPWPF